MQTQGADSRPVADRSCDAGSCEEVGGETIASGGDTDMNEVQLSMPPAGRLVHLAAIAGSNGILAAHAAVAARGITGARNLLTSSQPAKSRTALAIW